MNTFAANPGIRSGSAAAELATERSLLGANSFRRHLTTTEARLSNCAQRKKKRKLERNSIDGSWPRSISVACAGGCCPMSVAGRNGRRKTRAASGGARGKARGKAELVFSGLRRRPSPGARCSRRRPKSPSLGSNALCRRRKTAPGAPPSPHASAAFDFRARPLVAPPRLSWL